MKDKYVALLRGINVGGKHKVPMEELRKEMESLGFRGILTLLNSGNVIFEAGRIDIAKAEDMIAAKLQERFGFPVPVLLRKAADLRNIKSRDTFKSIEITKDVRLYVSFLKRKPIAIPALPQVSEDGSYRILELSDTVIFSVLDLSLAATPKAMDVLEQLFGKEITTRNLNTLDKIISKL